MSGKPASRSSKRRMSKRLRGEAWSRNMRRSTKSTSENPLEIIGENAGRRTISLILMGLSVS
jgi:hypothetical protein